MFMSRWLLFTVRFGAGLKIMRGGYCVGVLISAGIVRVSVTKVSESVRTGVSSSQLHTRVSVLPAHGSPID